MLSNDQVSLAAGVQSVSYKTSVEMRATLYLYSKAHLAIEKKGRRKGRRNSSSKRLERTLEEREVDHPANPRQL